MRACRTCITKYDLCPLFSELKFSSEQLFIATGVKIQPNDGLPQTVCKSCMKAITKSLHLREISSKAEEFLKTIAKHNVIKIERDGTIIDDTKKLTHNFSKTNSYFCNKEQNRIDESNVEDDIKPMVKYDRNGISITIKNDNAKNYEQLHETEFVDVKTEHEYSEYERNKNTKVKNCITLPNGAEIILYPTKVSERKSNNTAAESFKYSHVDSTVDFCESLEINQQALTNQIIAIKESTNHCMIKCKNRVNDCQSETYQTNKHVSGHYVSQNLDKISPQTVTVLAKTTKTSDRLSDIRFEDFNSSKELEELFKDTHKFGKNMDVPDEKPSQSGQKIANTQNVITKQKNCTSNEKSHRNLRNCEVKLVKKQFSAVKVPQEDLNIRKEDQGHENLFANLMSALKENLAKLVPNDTQETNVIRKKYNNIQPTKMDLSRRKYFQERNKNLMSLAVTPYTDGAIQCSVCSDVTRNKHSFRSHALKHFEKQHICQYAGCGKKFVHRSQLTRHVQCMHGVEKRFSCTQCGFRAADRPAMMNHIRAEHTGEKPFECNECGAKFRMRNNIIQHIKQVHNKPNKHLQCEFCSLRFQYRRDLWMHQDKAHFYTYNYYCYLCTNIYRSGCSTRKHLLKVHGVPKDQQLKLRRDKIRKPDAPRSSNVKPVVSNIPR